MAVMGEEREWSSHAERTKNVASSGLPRSYPSPSCSVASVLIGSAPNQRSSFRSWLLLLLIVLGARTLHVECCSINGGQLTRTFERIREELPTGAVIGVLNFDHPSNISNLRVVHGNRYFDLNTSTYSIVVKERLDVDDAVAAANLEQQPLSMQVRCINKQGVAFDIELWFHVEDVNDNVPYFVPSSSYVFSVSETAALATEVGQVLARDDDRDNLAIEYAIIEGDHSSYFGLRDKPGGSAALTLAATLDYEKSQQMTVLIAAMDCPHSGCILPSDRKTATSTVTVKITDADDQNPEFLGTPYEVFLADTSREGAVVIQARARDLDTLNAPLRYELSSHNDATAQAAYHVDSLSGVITVKNASYLHAGQLHLLQIRVYQLNDRSRRDSTTVVVRVVARDAGSSAADSPLQFDQRTYAVQVSEATPPGTAILMLVVNDLDPSRSIRFSIRSQPAEDMFRISSKRYSTGVLYLKRYLDYEARSQYELVVEVSNGNSVDTAMVTVTVLDVNDNNPEFKQDHYEFRVLMPAAAAVGGTVCGSVSATDRDAGSNLTYKLGSSYRELFGITSSGSIVMTGGVADYRADVYYLTVLATDGGSPPRIGTTTVTIYVARSSSAAVAAFNSAAKAPVQVDETDGYIVYIVAGVAGVLLVIVIVLVLYLARRKVKEAAKRMCTSPSGSTTAVEDGSLHLADKTLVSDSCLVKKQQANGFASGHIKNHTISDKVEKLQCIPLLPLNSADGCSTPSPSSAPERSAVKRSSYRAETKPGEPVTAPLLDAAGLSKPSDTNRLSDAVVVAASAATASDGSSTYTMRSKSPCGPPYTNLVYTRNGRTGVSVLYEEPPDSIPFPPPPPPLLGNHTEDKPASSSSSARRKLLPSLSKSSGGGSVDAEGTATSSQPASSGDERGSADGDALSGLVPLDGTPTLPKRRITWDRTVYVADDGDLETGSAKTVPLQAPASPTTSSNDDNCSLLISPPPSASSRQKLIINL